MKICFFPQSHVCLLLPALPPDRTPRNVLVPWDLTYRADIFLKHGFLTHSIPKLPPSALNHIRLSWGCEAGECINWLLLLHLTPLLLCIALCSCTIVSFPVDAWGQSPLTLWEAHSILAQIFLRQPASLSAWGLCARAFCKLSSRSPGVHDSVASLVCR